MGHFDLVYYVTLMHFSSNLDMTFFHPQFLVLENLLEKCPMLKHINLLRTHKSWHCTSEHSKDFIKTLSCFKSLVSLAINPCCIRANASEENSSHQNCDNKGRVLIN